MFSNEMRVKINVADTGVGMTEQQVQSLFKPFTKMMSNRSLNKDGVGLGLAVSLNIAQALGGSISVTSVHGKGSTFVVELPLKLKVGVRNSKYLGFAEAV